MLTLRTFWKHPRKVSWRRWAFQVHLWCGIALGTWALLMGFSGSVLVFKEEIDATLHPGVYVVDPAASRASLDRVAAAIQRQFPNHFLGGFRLLNEERHSAYVWIAREDEAGDLIDRYSVHFNQYTGKILGAQKRYMGFTGTLENLHFFLMIGRKGLTLNGIFAFVLLSLCATGVLIWWPGAGRWAQSLRITWSVGWKRLNYDTHRTLGMATALLLSVSSLTGAYFAFAAPARVLLATVTGGSETDIAAFYTPPASADASATRVTLDEAVAAATAALPTEARISGVNLPRIAGAAYTVDAALPGNPLLRRSFRVFVDAADGTPRRRHDSETLQAGVWLSQAMGPIHFGLWGGLPLKIVWSLLGLAPGTLAITGFVMWRNSRRNGRARAELQRRAASLKEQA